MRGALEALLEELADDEGGRVKLSRPQRDTRFSPDKSPYKTRAYGVILDRPASVAALYVELSLDGLFAGTGYYGLATDQLARFRAAIDDDGSGAELEAIVAQVRATGVETFGAALKTAPRGYPRDHPRVGLLRHKMLVAGRRVAPGADGIARGAALDLCRTTWSACTAMNGWLDEHVGPSELPAVRR